MSSDWRDDLADAVRRGLRADGLDAVVEEFEGHLADHPDTPVDPFRPLEPVLGLVPCEAGFLGVLAQPDGRVSVHAARSTEALLEQVGESVDAAIVIQGSEPSTDTAAARARLASVGFTVPAWFSGSGFSEAELLAACAAVIEAN